MSAALLWFRRDLRLSDQPALQAALKSTRSLIPVFILDPALLKRDAPNRQAFLFAALSNLDAELRKLGSRLVIRGGEPLAVLTQLMAETGADSIYASQDVSPYARRRDDAVAAVLPLHLLSGLTLHPLGAVTKPDGSPYTVFTPFSKAWKALPLPGACLSAPAALPPVPEGLFSEPLPEVSQSSLLAYFPASESEAQCRLKNFVAGPIFSYANERDRLDLQGTSALSPYLRFGMLSARQAVLAAQAAAQQATDAQSRQGCETWLNELIWREFYNQLLHFFPTVLTTAFNPSYRAVRWRSAPDELLAWQQGLTGYPVVDAAMRQLRATGWMHNRARMITASFLVKDLLINWQAGESWFMHELVDGDPAANNGGWQWTAGVGTDAAPYFRIFNPVLQSKKFDPQGNYIRQWLPELSGVPQAYLHSPWEMPAEMRIKVEYPAPIVDHAVARVRTLDAYKHNSLERS